MRAWCSRSLHSQTPPLNGHGDEIDRAVAHRRLRDIPDAEPGEQVEVVDSLEAACPVERSIRSDGKTAGRKTAHVVLKLMDTVRLIKGPAGNEALNGPGGDAAKIENRTTRF